MQQVTPPGVLCVPLRDRHGVVVAVALLDAEDHALAEQSWHLSSTGYAARVASKDGIRQGSLLHREVLGLKIGDPRFGDHINRDRMDCRRENLRIVTRAQSAQNVSANRQGTSAHRGVSWDAGSHRWRAQAGGQHLGLFNREEDAAAAATAARAERMPFAVEAVAA